MLEHMIPRARHLAVILAACMVVCTPPALADPYRFQDAGRIVAIGDVHGAFDELVEVLTGTGLIDDEHAWTGGATHLVSLGDLLSRGDHGRQVMDLLMRLEDEAAAAGGAVHVVLGNHEVMSLTGDLRYISEGDYAQFGGRDARRAAFAPDGVYGRWLLGKPVMIEIDGYLFLHGGLSTMLDGMSLEGINAAAMRDVRRFVEGWHAFLDAGLLDAAADFDAIMQRANALSRRGAPDRELRDLARGMVEALDGLAFHPDGPLWYRRSALCHPYDESQVTRQALARLGADKVVIGHTPTPHGRITSRFDGRVYRIDSGMNHEAYNGRPSALVIEDGEARAFYAGEGMAEVVAEPNRYWARPYGMSDEEIEAFLLAAEVTESKEYGVGVTGIRRLTLELDGRSIRASFKTIDTDPMLQRSLDWPRMADHADRYMYEIAAYHLDRLLGMEMVPVTVERSFDGERGALQYWVEDAMNETDRRERGIRFDGHCGWREQQNSMNVFDLLIHNEDRNQGDILWDRDWMLWMIDHSRSFGTQRGIPAEIPRGIRITVTPEMAEALERVSRENLEPLAPYLHRRQRQALVDRARWLLRHGEIVVPGRRRR